MSDKHQFNNIIDALYNIGAIKSKGSTVVGNYFALNESTIREWLKDDENSTKTISIGKKEQIAKKLKVDTQRLWSKWEDKSLLENYLKSNSSDRLSIFTKIDKNYKKTISSDDEVEFLKNIKDLPDIELVADLPEYDLTNISVALLIEFAQYLLDISLPQEAIYVLSFTSDKEEAILDDDIFIQINKIRAISLSDDQMKKFEEAKNILLEIVMRYQCKNKDEDQIEIMRLLAANYKRLALYDENGKLFSKQNINKDYLLKSLERYEALCETNPNDFYASINLAYLYKMFFARDTDKIDKLKTLLQTIKSNWNPDFDNWWGLVSQIEFLILEGRHHQASEMTNRIEDLSKSPSISDINSTIRQLDIYLHFTNDAGAIGIRKILQSYLEIYLKG
jgi:hypothetical protein